VCVYVCVCLVLSVFGRVVVFESWSWSCKNGLHYITGVWAITFELSDF